MALLKPLIILVATFLLIHSTTAQLGAMMEIEDVEHNKEVQDLGKYSVEQYNIALTKKHGSVSSNKVLSFVEVTSAVKQIVSGTKYYLKVSAVENGVKKMFESQIVVKPWIKKTPKTMLSFRRFTKY